MVKNMGAGLGWNVLRESEYMSKRKKLAWVVNGSATTATTQMSCSAADLGVIFEWVEDVVNEATSAEVFRAECIQLTKDVVSGFLQRRDCYCKYPRPKYQLVTVAALYVCSAYATNMPYSSGYLLDVSMNLYTRAEFYDAIRDVLSWVVQTCAADPEGPMDPVVWQRRLSTHTESVVDAVVLRTPERCTVVRKRIPNQCYGGMPCVSAVVELMAHWHLRRTLSSASSDRIVHLRSACVMVGHVDLFYEYVPFSLGEYMKNPLVPRLLCDVAEGLVQLHDAGVAHRDVKVDNLRVGMDRRGRIIDLGAAGHGSVRTTVPICTISTRSPDVLATEVKSLSSKPSEPSEPSEPYDPRSLDVWSFGVVALTMFTGSCPFGPMTNETTAEEALEVIETYLQRRLMVHLAGLPSGFRSILRECLSRDPAMRPTMRAVLDTWRTVMSAEVDTEAAGTEDANQPA